VSTVARGNRLPVPDEEVLMAVARVVFFDGVGKDRAEEMKREMESGQAPEGMPSSEIVVLHDPEAEKSLVVVFFESEADYATGDAILDAMPASDTPGRRASVTKYDVVSRMSM
jgi:hypothetical protein